MDSLETLIKLHKRELDRQRRRQVDLEKQKDEMLALDARLQDELAHERKLASQNPLLTAGFGPYAQRVKQKREGIRVAVMTLDKEIEKIRELIREGFAELKKFEIAKQNQEKREKSEQERKERILLDEIAGQRHEKNKHPH